jgi:hypothetical protein
MGAGNDWGKPDFDSASDEFLSHEVAKVSGEGISTRYIFGDTRAVWGMGSRVQGLCRCATSLETPRG